MVSTPREPRCVKLIGRISALTSIWLQWRAGRQSMFFVPSTTGFSFTRCFKIVTWIGQFSFNSIEGSNLTSSLSPTNSNMKVSSKIGSLEACTIQVLNLFFRKLTVTESYSSGRILTKSTNALPRTTEQLMYRLLGSRSFAFIIRRWLGATVGRPLLCRLSLFERELLTWTAPPAALLIGFLFVGICWRISFKTPSDLSFSIIWFLSSLLSFGSLATALLSPSKNLCFSRCCLITPLTYSICTLVTALVRCWFELWGRGPDIFCLLFLL